MAPVEPEPPVDLEARWRDLRWFGAARDPDDDPLDHHRLAARLEQAGVPLPARVAEVEAFLASTDQLEAFDRFHTSSTAFRQSLNPNMKGTTR